VGGKNGDWLRPDTRKSPENRRRARCLSPSFHNLSGYTPFPWVEKTGTVPIFSTAKRRRDPVYVRAEHPCVQFRHDCRKHRASPSRERQTADSTASSAAGQANRYITSQVCDGQRIDSQMLITQNDATNAYPGPLRLKRNVHCSGNTYSRGLLWGQSRERGLAPSPRPVSPTETSCGDGACPLSRDPVKKPRILRKDLATAAGSTGFFPAMRAKSRFSHLPEGYFGNLPEFRCQESPLGGL
jgi:hypothetical protein